MTGRCDTPRHFLIYKFTASVSTDAFLVTKIVFYLPRLDSHNGKHQSFIIHLTAKILIYHTVEQ